MATWLWVLSFFNFGFALWLRFEGLVADATFQMALAVMLAVIAHHQDTREENR